MVAGQLGADELVAEDRRHAEVEAHSPAKRGPTECSEGHRNEGQRAVAAAAAGQSRSGVAGGVAAHPAQQLVEMEDV